MPRSLTPILLGFALSACSERPPPQARGGEQPLERAASAAPGAAPALSAPGESGPPATGLVPTSPAVSTQALAASASSATASQPPLLDSSGRPLPQTDERPALSPSFQARMELLFRAILAGDASLAESCFFPGVAYEQVKAIEQPARDWKLRLMKAFERDVRTYHERLGASSEAARFIGVEVPEARAQWMKPGSEGNRLGYFRVLRSRLKWADGAGKEHSFEVTSMISWRGEWYVVHLNGFK